MVDTIKNDKEVTWYFRDGRIHRDNDKPAIIWKNGSISYFNMGKRHRTNGPARIGHCGEKEWYFNGRRHRADGPAVSKDLRETET